MQLKIKLNRKQNSIIFNAANKFLQSNLVITKTFIFTQNQAEIQNQLIFGTEAKLKNKTIAIACNNFKVYAKKSIQFELQDSYIYINSYKININFNDVSINTNIFNLKAPFINFTL